jgi:hypothetical protein
MQPRARALEVLLNDFIDHYAEQIIDDSEKYVFMFAHNLLYDLCQLVKYYPDILTMIRTGIGLTDDYVLYEYGDYKVSLNRNGLFEGTAPHFDIRIQETKKRYFTIKFRDTFSFFPSSLDSITRYLQVTAKRPRPEGIGQIDYRDFEPSDERRLGFEEYALIDAKGTRETAEKIRMLHKSAGMKRMRVSAPGYAIAKLYHMLPDGVGMYSGTSNAETMQLVIDAYAGGRTGGVFHGYAENITVLDFHSSYPASMTTLPSFSKAMEYFRYPNPEHITIPELMELINSVHCFLRVDGIETDAEYPALIQTYDGKLTPVFGHFENIATTGIELCVGLKSGTLQLLRIRELVVLIEQEEPECLPFKLFAENAYHRKGNAEKDSPEYLSAKLELNSSYGKLIESHNENHVDSDIKDVILPYEPEDAIKYGNIYYEMYIHAVTEPDPATAFQTATDGLIEYMTENGIEYKLADFEFLSLTKLEYGRWVIPAAAALITATSRARLIAAIRATKALYWDTDSVFIEQCDLDAVREQFVTATSWLPDFAQPITVGDHLGEMGIEIENASGYLAGTKRYYIESPDGHYKKALHGIPTAPYDQAEKMIEALATGYNYKYQGKARPLTAREAKTAEDIGRFAAAEYESRFELDNRQTWTKTERGWRGQIKPFGM